MCSRDRALIRPFAIVRCAWIALLLMLPSEATSKNLDDVVKPTYGAYLANQESSVCAASRLDFAAEDMTTFKDESIFAAKDRLRCI